MTARQRFNAWRAIVVATLLANVGYAVFGWAAAFVVSTAALLGMLALLVTTPADAIVLPRGRSERILVAGFVIAAAIASRGQVDGIAVALGVLAIGIALLTACRWRSISAWWAALVIWQPLWLSAIRATV